MDIYVIAIIILTAAIQSLFGVGVLLFGTPLLLLLGYPFSESLLILLPVSALINSLQIVKDYRYIDVKVYKNILLYSIPMIVIFLYLVSKINLNVSLFIGIFLILIALKDFSFFVKHWLNKLLSFDKLFYITMGVIHGVTNLGGALLTAKIFHTNLNKYQKRATIAISYMSFALFQILTLLFLNFKFNYANIIYIFAGLVVYLIINKLFFHQISDQKYNKLFTLFLILSGLSLIFKGLVW